MKYLRKYNESNNIVNVSEGTNFIDVVLKTLRNMEVEYYDKYLFKKK